MSAWKTCFTRLKGADHEEVKRTLDVLFMPHIKRYLEIYNAGGGFPSLPSFGEGGLNASIQGTPHTETQEPILDKLGIARSPCSFVTSEGPSSDDNTSSARDDARSSERLDKYVDSYDSEQLRPLPLLPSVHNVLLSLYGLHGPALRPPYGPYRTLSQPSIA
jgi:hypothetical protein